MINKDERDTAFLSNKLPSNPRPFINRLYEIMFNSMNDHSFIKSKEFRSNLWIILTTIYGQTEIDIEHEWLKLKEEFENDTN